MKDLTSQKMLTALKRLDQLLPQPTQLIIGGGSAMILAHGFPLSTYDIDAIVKNRDFSEIDPLVKQVAKEQEIPGDWLNPWFVTFTHVLPSDTSAHLIQVFKGKKLSVEALGKNEMLIMKCFAHRAKDIGHSKALIKGGANLEKVRSHIENLAEKNIPGCEEALSFLDDVEDQI